MLRRALQLLSLVGSFALSCGGVAATQGPTVVAVGSVAPAKPDASGRRGASDELKKRWPFDGQPRFAVYADLGGLQKTELVRGVLPSLLALAKSFSTSDALAACRRDAASSVSELAIGSDERGTLTIARYDATSTWNPRDCFEGPLVPLRLAGAREAFAMDRQVVALQPGFVLFGPQELVSLALFARGQGASLARLDLSSPEYITFRADLGKGEMALEGALSAASNRFRVHVDADLHDERKAMQLERSAAEARTEMTSKIGVKGEEKRMLEHVLESLTLKRSGSHLVGAFELNEPVADQARDIGMVAALSVFGVRKYIANAKATEARNVLGQLARDIVTDWEREDFGPRGKRYLVAYPPVPKSVPRGVKYQSTPADWKPWDRLRFSMEAPQYFQYEVKVTDGGEGAEVIAHGDLNGDGKTSTFKLSMKVDRANDTIRVAPSILEQDPEE